MPSLKNSFFGSPLMLTNGSTATDLGLISAATGAVASGFAAFAACVAGYVQRRLPPRRQHELVEARSTQVQ